MKLSEKLKKAPLIFDGAMGTYYAQKFGHEPEFCEMANIEFPKRIEKIHREYIAAGAQAIKTNTFGANALALDCPYETVQSIIESAWNISQSAVSGTDTAVFADIGPIPAAKDSDPYPEYLSIVDKFIELGAENFLFETFSSPEHLTKLSKHIKKAVQNSTVICSFAVMPDGFTREGVAASAVLSELRGISEIDAVGFNCACGPTHMAKLVAQNAGYPKPFSAMPNAGYPTLIGGRTYFENNAQYYAQSLSELRTSGVLIFGGCCGTTPDHIKKLSQALSERRSVADAHIVSKSDSEKTDSENLLWQKLDSGKRVFAVELDPPENADISKFMRGAKALRDAGADAVTIADCPVSRARVDSSILACKIKRELGIDPIPHMTCRDRNIIATKALLLGLNIEGVNNALVVTGDPVPTAERGTINSVFNFNSMVLSRFICDLSPELQNGPFKVFCALNLNAVNFEAQLHHAQDKLDHGASGFLTQPVHSERALQNLIHARNELDCKILGGIMPIVSYKNACFMNSEIAGITVSDEIIKKYKGLDRDEASRLAVELTTETGLKMAPYVDGYYIITPFSRTDLVCKIMNNLK